MSIYTPANYRPHSAKLTAPSQRMRTKPHSKPYQSLHLSHYNIRPYAISTIIQTTTTTTMELPTLLTLFCAILSASAAQVSITVSLPAKPNPFLLPPSTHATLSSLHKRLDAPLTAVNTFSFHNVSADSYLLDVHCATDTFQPLRVDVGEDGAVKAWETFRGNEWGNKGEEVPVKSEGESRRGFSVKALGGKIFFLERPACEFLLYICV